MSSALNHAAVAPGPFPRAATPNDPAPSHEGIDLRASGPVHVHIHYGQPGPAAQAANARRLPVWSLVAAAVVLAGGGYLAGGRRDGAAVAYLPDPRLEAQAPQPALPPVPSDATALLQQLSRSPTLTQPPPALAPPPAPSATAPAAPGVGALPGGGSRNAFGLGN